MPGPDDGALPPPDPVSLLAEASAQLHELFLAYQAAGFNPAQALYLCGQVLRGASGGAA